MDAEKCVPANAKEMIENDDGAAHNIELIEMAQRKGKSRKAPSKTTDKGLSNGSSWWTVSSVTPHGIALAP